MPLKISSTLISSICGSSVLSFAVKMSFLGRKNYEYLQVTFRTQKAFTSINKDQPFYIVNPPFHLAADPDPDPAFVFDEDTELTFLLMRIPFLLLIKVMRICNHLRTDFASLHFEPLYVSTASDQGSLWLHYEPP
jgi:hypothetical protein